MNLQKGVSEISQPCEFNFSQTDKTNSHVQI